MALCYVLPLTPRHAARISLVIAQKIGDPLPGVVKQLKIQYRINDKPGEASFAENATIMLPTP